MIKKIFKYAVKILGFLVISIMIGYCVFMMNAKFLLHEQLPMLAGYGNAVVLSGSMEPEFTVNDWLIIHEQESYEVGDIITFIDNDNMLVTHRIIKINDDEIITQGDANNIHDKPISNEQIKGKVIKIVPKLGYIISFIQNPFFIVTIVVLTFILMERSYSKEKAQKSDSIEALKAELEKLKSENESQNDN